MTVAEVAALPQRPADARLAYGDHPLQFADLRLPQGEGPHPVAAVIHGGCWIERFAQLTVMSPLATALAEAGVATWNLEYRRLDSAGGAWPASFVDIAKGIDHLRALAADYPLDLERVVVVGHSAGGHLALWAAARPRLPKESALYVADPLPLAGVVSLAGPGDLRAFDDDKMRACGTDIVPALLGGATTGQRLRQASPAELLPLGVKQILLTGADDRIVPARFASAYAERARAAGDKVEVGEIENAGHFELIAPGSIAWPRVEAAILSLLNE